MAETHIDESPCEQLTKVVLSHLESLKASMLVWGLVAFNSFTTGCEIFYDFTSKSVRGAMDAHVQKVWVFTERNSTPWELTEAEAHTYKYPLVYFPESNKLSGDQLSVLEGGVFSFDDVAMAEIKSPEGTTLDLSSTFHNLRWKAGFTPSLYEVAVIHCLKNKLCFLTGKLGNFTIEILTADAKTITHLLDSSVSRLPFTPELRV
jgi:hypothetical protein